MRAINKQFIINIIFTAVCIFILTGCQDQDLNNGNDLTYEGTNVIDGLWWNEALIKGTHQYSSQGLPGVWVLQFPDFWFLNLWGYAHKGKYSVNGTASGSFTATSTSKKDGTAPAWVWKNAAASDVIKANWEFDDDGNTLRVVVQTGNIFIPSITIDYQKTTWNAPVNGTGFPGETWQEKINDPFLYAISQ